MKMRSDVPALIAQRRIVLVGCSGKSLDEIHRIAVQQIHVPSLATSDHEIGVRNYHSSPGAEVYVILLQNCSIIRSERRRRKRRSIWREFHEGIAKPAMNHIRMAITCQEINVAVSVSRQTAPPSPDSGAL